MARPVFPALIAVALLLGGADARSDEPDEPATQQPAETPAAKPPAQPPTMDTTREAICLLVEAAAKANDLPVEFFARVIWQESRFQSDAIGPLTRSGQRAQGIAQFMPGTAAERRLLDPFDPVQALPKSAEFLKDLRAQFGNLGLAAAAYNAGPRRVQEWIAGTGGIPSETRHYVTAITGRLVEDWLTPEAWSAATVTPPASNCRELIALLKRAPNPFVDRLEQTIKLAEAQPWGVQLAAGFSRDRALGTYVRLLRRLSKVIGERDPYLQSTLLRSRGTRPLYQVRIGTDTRPAADEMCAKIRRSGEACLVLRNKPNVARNAERQGLSAQTDTRAP